MSMQTVSVASFKQKLSQYLRMVSEGQELLVTSHQRPVARVIAESPGLAIRAPLRPIAALHKINGITLASPGLALDMLMEDRHRR